MKRRIFLEHNGVFTDRTSSIASISPCGQSKWTVVFNDGGRYDISARRIKLVKVSPEEERLEREATIAEEERRKRKERLIAKIRPLKTYYQDIALCTYELQDKEAQRVADGVRSALGKSYGKLTVEKVANSAAAFLADPSSLPTSLDRDLPVIYPFGGNLSQMKATRKALSSGLTVIEGPPGTGKTHVILTIVANLLYRGNSVLIASNNNSAVQNVSERLENHGLGFCVAELGNQDNRAKFFQTAAERKALPDNIASKKLKTRKVETLEKRLLSASEKLEKAYAAKELLAKIRQDLRDIQLEQSYLLKERTVEPCGLELRRWASPTGAKIAVSAASKALERTRPVGLFLRYLLPTVFGIGSIKQYENPTNALLQAVSEALYSLQIARLKRKAAKLERICESKRVRRLESMLQQSSELLLWDTLARRYDGSRPFTRSECIENPVLMAKPLREEFPVQTSTVHLAFSQAMQAYEAYDYAIIDEASQASLETGFLALCAAKRAVVVGDRKQLAPVITAEQAKAAPKRPHEVPERLDWQMNSLLDAAREALAAVDSQDACSQLLVEHYRCHPDIIGFCNKRFYGGALRVMTPGFEREKTEEDSPLTCVVTHAASRVGRMNALQARSAAEEVLPKLESEGFTADKVAIIAPYNDQVDLLGTLSQDSTSAATVHKYQGREAPAVILSTVKDCDDSFVNDERLVNVAVSRASKRFVLLVEADMLRKQCLVADLARYIEYHRGDVVQSGIRPAFPFLFGMDAHGRNGTSTEAATERMLIDELSSKSLLDNIGICRRYPLFLLVPASALKDLDNELQKFLSAPSHIDLLMYRKVDSMPMAAVEVDGMQHTVDAIQATRDKKKERILKSIGLPLFRVRTTAAEDEAHAVVKRAVTACVDGDSPRTRKVIETYDRQQRYGAGDEACSVAS